MVVTVLFAVHVLLSWIVVNHIEIGFRGNPAVWYPMAVFLVLALASGWQAAQKGPTISGLHLLLALWFLASSLAVVYFARTLFMAAQLILLVPVYPLLGNQISRSTLILVLATVIAVGLSAYARDPLLRYIVLGAQACVIAYLLLPRRAQVSAVAPSAVGAQA